MENILNHINFCQRAIIVNSYLYYERDYNVLTDKQYDDNCKHLVNLKNKYPDLWKQSEYYKQFGDDYNGATGFTLYHDLHDHQKAIIRSIANYALA